MASFFFLFTNKVNHVSIDSNFHIRTLVDSRCEFVKHTRALTDLGEIETDYFFLVLVNSENKLLGCGLVLVPLCIFEGLTCKTSLYFE